MTVSDPIELFREWYSLVEDAGLHIPGAMCLSTVDAGGATEARFVDLKDVSTAGFVFCTHLESPKAVALIANPSCALTFWWDHIERQVRVAGTAAAISDVDADRYFADRGRSSQIVAHAFTQSQPLAETQNVDALYAAAATKFEDRDVPRPPDWRGFCVAPKTIEFLTFLDSRVHSRTLYTRSSTVPGDVWTNQSLQP